MNLTAALARLIFAPIFVATLLGCSPRVVIPPLMLRGDLATPELRLHLYERSLARLSLVQSARVSYEASFPLLSPQPLRAALLVEQSSSALRLEFLPPTLATSLLLFVSSQEDSRLLLPATQQAFTSDPSSAGLLRSFFRIPLPDADFGLICLGLLPHATTELLRDPQESTIRCDASDCLMQANRSHDQWLLDRDSGQVKAVLLFDRFQRDPVISLQMGDATPLPDTPPHGYSPPVSIRFAYPRQRIFAALSLVKTTINPKLNSELFRVAIPTRYALARAPKDAHALPRQLTSLTDN